MLTIPKGKKLEIWLNSTKLLPSYDLEIEDDITLALNSTFSPLVGESGNTVTTLIGQVSRDIFNFGFSGQFKELGFQLWKSTDPMKFSISTVFKMRTDAYKDVVVPSKELIKLPLPNDAGIDTDGIGLIPPGPSILEVFKKDNTSSSQNYAGKAITIKVGNMLFLDRVVVTRAEPTYSIETDTNDYPIWCKIQLDIVTLFTATTNLIDKQIGV